MVAFFATSIFVPGCRCKSLSFHILRKAGFWKFVVGMQELMLVAMVNMRYHHVSKELVSVLDGASFINFGIFSPIFRAFSRELQGEVDYNVFSDYVQFHPYIFSMLGATLRFSI